MDSTPHLTTLPLEILQFIIEHTHASGHWPLAQTCKHLYLNSQPILNRHRRAFQKYRISSDLHPLTVPNLLWSALSHGAASIDAWHVREFEVWADRLDGISFEVDADDGGVRASEREGPWSFPADDIDFFCDKLFKVPEFFDYEDATYYEQVREELEKGHDTLLKSFMLTQLPRIRALRYARLRETQLFSFKYLCEMIRWCKIAENFLPGLKTLEKVSVGISLGRIENEPGIPRPSKRSGDEFYALLSLPNLSEVYFAHLDEDFSHLEEDFELDDTVFPSGPRPPLDKTSPVKTIILDGVETNLSDDLMHLIATAPRGLQNLAIRFRGEDGWSGHTRHQVGRELSKHQRQSLQRLCFYNDADKGLTILNWMSPAHIVKFDELRVVSMDLLYVETEYIPGNAKLSRSKLKDKLFKKLQYKLPARLEIADFEGIDLWEGAFVSGQLGRHKLDYLDDAVEAMLKSERYKNLKAVLLENLQDLMSAISVTLLEFPKTIKAAEERGIYVHLKGSEPPPGLIINGQFVPIPTRDCMVTGRFLPEVREHSRPHAYEDMLEQRF